MSARIGLTRNAQFAGEKIDELGRELLSGRITPAGVVSELGALRRALGDQVVSEAVAGAGALRLAIERVEAQLAELRAVVNVKENR